MQEAIDFSDENAYPIGAHPDHDLQHYQNSTQCSSDDAGWSEDEETQFNLPEEFRLLGEQCKELLMAGEEIKDELLVQLFVTRTRMLYKYKSPKTKRKELKLKARKTIDIESRLVEISARLSEEGLKKKEIKALESESDRLKGERMQLEELEQEKGWVLVDFPTTYAQAKLLE